MFNKQKQKKDFVRINHMIRVPRVRLIKDEVNHGIVSIQEAQRLAQEADLDLVEVAPHANPPVCQIMDFGKYKFDKKKKEKEKKHQQTKEKEICFRYVIDEHDLQVKANHIKEFLQKGFRVKVTVKFKSREKAHKEQGFIALQRCLELVGDIAHIDKVPTMEGQELAARLDLNRAKLPKEPAQ